MQGPKNSLKALEYLELFFDHKVYSLIVAYSNNYALKRNKVGEIFLDEVKVFIVIVLLSGYNSVARNLMHWNQLSDCHNSLVSSAIHCCGKPAAT